MPGLSEYVMREVEMPLIPIVADLEDTGYAIDCDHFTQLRDRLEPERDRVLKRIRKTAGKNFNPGSSPQLRTFLYCELKLKTAKRTPTGAASTSNKVLERFAKNHEVVADILRYRALTKILGTYCSIPDKVNEDGRLRVSFNQLDTVTGRFSSDGIIQTLPKNDEFQIRKGFVASEGHRIVGADFDQQELRVLAQCSGDKKMKAAIKGGVDLHGLAAVKVFKLNCAPNDVKAQHKDKRDQVKAVQFGLLYGKTSHSLAEDLGIDKEEADQLVEDYFKQFPAVKRFIDGVHKRLTRDGFVDDVFGRRRYFPDATRKRPQKEWRYMSEEQQALVFKINKAKREAQNFVIQGASATITKLAMIRCHRHIGAEHPEIKMLLTLHDELQFEVPCELVDHFAQELTGLMCDVGLERFGFDVPMAVEVKMGPSWGELAKWKGGQDGNNNASATRR